MTANDAWVRSGSHRGGRPRRRSSVRVGAAQLEPGLLQGVIGLGPGAEHSEGDSLQVAPVGLELLGQPRISDQRASILTFQLMPKRSVSQPEVPQGCLVSGILT
jgi:hypothetical protein